MFISFCFPHYDYLMKFKQALSTNLGYIGIGIFNVTLFHYAIYRLWFFLYDSTGRQHSDSIILSLIVNTLLILFFSIPHSVLLMTKVKSKILEYVPHKLFGTIYSIHACVAIMLLDNFWFEIGTPNLIQSEWAKNFHIVGYVVSWSFMFYAMLSTSLFKQSGIDQWYQG